MVSVSVVIPVYNVEKYLNECMDSIVNQTLSDIEIICINDGSTDNSLDILQEYASCDDRIIIFNQKNQGHAVATNKGIEMARGEYLFLMDSDDILKLNALELTYNEISEKKVDFVLFKSLNYDDQKDEYYESENFSMNNIFEVVGNEIFDYNDIKELMFNACVTPWSKLYSREFIIRENIRFPEGLIFDDNVFFYESLLKAKRISFLDEFLFIRRWYATSSTMNGDLRFADSMPISNKIIEVFRDNNEYDNYKYNLLNNKIEINVARYFEIKKQFKSEYFNILREDFKQFLETKDVFEEIVSTLEDKNRKNFYFVILSENNIEFDQLRQLNDKYENITELNYNLDELQLKQKNLKKKNDDLLNSNSWKLTKVFRL